VTRIKRGVTAHRRHKKVLEQTKGHYGSPPRNRKRDFRRLWIVRINAAARLHGLTYSRLIDGMKKAGIELNRKVLADLAVASDADFNQVVERARAALAAGV